MLSLKKVRNRTAIGLAVVLQLVFFPAITLAEEVPASTGAEPTAVQTAPAPNGYTYNPTAELWENEKYTWNPKTFETKPKALPAPPAPEPVIVQPIQTTALTVPSEDAPAVAPSSTAGQNKASQQSATGAEIHNTVDSDAQTGDATVTQNTSAGDATSGNALAMTQLVNTIQSTWNMQGGISTFTTNINGPVSGDLVLAPTLQSSNNSLESANLTVKTDVDNQIINDVSLSAASGSATVSSNTSAGDAASGSANALANVINLINSTVSAGQSFVGNVNIFGSLDGDILLPDAMMRALRSDGASIATLELDNNSPFASLAADQNVTNNITTAATTGAAEVSGNTTAGNATSGQAKTKLNVLNLSGSNVIGKNSLLVFVNVLGTWVGIIVDSPEGTTSATLGDAEAQQIKSTEASLKSSSRGTIINNIDVAATTGNASVTDNTTAGNATSGDATASANVVNVVSSNLSLADWFGILFINVFGSWNGSFGVDTAAGGWTTQTNQTNMSTQPGQNPPQQTITQIKVFRLGTAPSGGPKVPVRAAVAPAQNEPDEQETVLAAYSDEDSQNEPSAAGGPMSNDRTPPRSMSSLTVSCIILAAAILATERYLAYRSRQTGPSLAK